MLALPKPKVGPHDGFYHQSKTSLVELEENLIILNKTGIHMRILGKAI